MKHLIFVTKILLLTSAIGLMTGCGDGAIHGESSGVNEHGHSHD